MEQLLLSSMNIAKSSLFLIGILLVAVFLRLYQLGTVPVGPDWDEAAIGYNASSLLATGKDEFGKTLPLVFRSFNDYKPPLYIYLTVPAIALFGLNTWAVRLPSAIAGILAVIGTYLLVVELLKSQIPNPNDQQGKKSFIGNWKLEIGNSKSVALLSAMLLALSPWHIQFSRVAFEANIGVTLNIWATIFFLRGLRNAKYYLLSSIVFVLAMYAYHTERIFVPLYVALLGFVFLKPPIRHSKELLWSLGIALVLMLPILGTLVNNTGLERLSSTGILTKKTEYLEKSVAKYNWDTQRGSLLGQFLNDRRFEWVKVYASGYLSHFSPKWLFVTGDHPRHHAPDSGLLYLWTIPFLCAGFLVLIKKSKDLAHYFIGWLLLAPIAAAFTFEAPHAVRTLVILPSFQIITAIGLWAALRHVYAFMQSAVDGYKKIIIIVVSFCFVGFSLFEITRYLNLYFVHMNVEYSKYWQYGYKQAVDYAEDHSAEYKKIVVSTDLEQPYIFFLFYSTYDPKKYLAQEGPLFNKYEFRKIDWPNEKKDGSILYIGTPGEIVYGNRANITYPDGTPAIHIADRE